MYTTKVVYSQETLMGRKVRATKYVDTTFSLNLKDNFIILIIWIPFWFVNYSLLNF